MSSPTKLFFKMLFGKNPQITENIKRTDRLHATVDGELNWMKCRPKLTQNRQIECEDGKTYKRIDETD